MIKIIKLGRYDSYKSHVLRKSAELFLDLSALRGFKLLRLTIYVGTNVGKCLYNT